MDATKLAALLVLPLLLAACSPTVGSLCTAGPIVLDPGAAERWTRSEKEQVLTLNNAGAPICGWRPIS